MVSRQLPKLKVRVRFPSSAPKVRLTSSEPFKRKSVEGRSRIVKFA